MCVCVCVGGYVGVWVGVGVRVGGWVCGCVGEWFVCVVSDRFLAFHTC